MFLTNLIQAANFKITEGSEFLWKCFGSNARILDFCSDSEKSCVSCVFDYKTQKVYEVNIYSSDDKNYRWIDKDFVDAVKKESLERNIDFLVSSVENLWIELDNESDVLRKTKQIIESDVCGDEVMVTLDLDNDVLMKLCLFAHEKNITLNELIVEIINEHIKMLEKCEQSEG